MEKKKKCTGFRARDGHIVPILYVDGKERHLGSNYDGVYAAKCWADTYISERTENIILLGMGDCQIILELTKRVPGKILVYEPELLIYQQMKTNALYKKVVKNHKVDFFCGETQSEIINTIKDLLDDDWVERTMFVKHPGYHDLYQKEFDNLQQACKLMCDDISLMRPSLKRSIVPMIRNQIANVPQMRGTIPLRKLKARWNKNMPIILVSAGPSLDNNVEELKKAKGRAQIWCADAALTTLLAHGIVPDLVASIDAAKNMNCFSDPRSMSIPLLCSSNTRRELLKKSRGIKIWGYDHKQIHAMMERSGIPLPEVPYYLGVSTAMYAAAVEMGSEVLIFVGQDLAFSKSGSSHVKGRDESALNVKKYITEGYYGDKVWSRGDWIEFKKWFEMMLVIYPERTVINATEGGAHIAGTKQLPLGEVLDLLPEVENNFDTLLSEKRNYISENEFEILERQMHQCVKDLEMIEEWGYRKIFFEKDYRRFPVMSMVIDYMKVLDDEREERFGKSVAFVKKELAEGGWSEWIRG